MKKAALSILLVLILKGNSYAQTVESFMGQTNGAIYSIQADANYLYVGGEFSRVAAPQNISGGISSVNISSGLSETFPPILGTVFSVISDGNGGWYLGGDFTQVGGIATKNLAHIKADLSIDQSFLFTMNGIVRALELKGTSLIIGGEFTTINNLSRCRLAMIDSNGLVNATWNPCVNNSVYTISAFGNDLFVGGFFSSISGQSRSNIAKISLLGSGSVDTGWNPGANGTVLTLSVKGNDLYLGGLFTQLATLSKSYIAKISTLGSGDVDASWGPSPNSYVNVIVSKGNDVYFGGAFTTVNNIGIPYLAKVTANTGSLSSTWNLMPNAMVESLYITGNTLFVGGSFTSVNNQPNRSYLTRVNLVANTVDAWATGINGPVKAITGIGNSILIGGGFTFTAGVTCGNLARFSLTTGELDNSWTPTTNGRVESMMLVNNKLIVGGSFTQINGISRNALGMINIPDGATDSWNPNVSGIIKTIAVDQQSVYAGGIFSSVGSSPIKNIAKFSLTSSTPDPAWNLSPNGQVRTITIKDGNVYLGGDFTTIQLQSRSYLAKFNTEGAFVSTWDAKVNGSVYTTLADNNNLYIGGTFSDINSKSCSNIASVSLNTAAFDGTWNPRADGAVTTLGVASGGIIVAGSFNSVGGAVRNGLAKILPTGLASEQWLPSPNDAIRSVYNLGNKLYLGGSFTSIDSKAFYNLSTIVSSPILKVFQNSVEIMSETIQAFGEVNVNSSKEIITQIKNSGEAPLVLSSISINSTHFKTDGVALPLTIDAGQSATLKLIFSPSTSGNLSGVIVLQTNSANVPVFTINLTGTSLKLNQSITFNALVDKSIGDAPFKLNASATSSLQITYTSSNENIATISGDLVTIKNIGEVVITATQTGNDIYNQAVSVSRTLKINSITGIDNADSEISIYPNPTSDWLTIKSSDDSKKAIALFDGSGKICGDIMEAKSTLTLDLKNLSKGIYYLKIETSTGNKIMFRVSKQ